MGFTVQANIGWVRFFDVSKRTKDDRIRKLFEVDAEVKWEKKTGKRTWIDNAKTERFARKGGNRRKMRSDVLIKYMYNQLLVF